MMLSDMDLATMQLPAEFAAIPISVSQLSASLKICAVVSIKPDPVAGHLVLLRGALDAKALLGCIVDAEQRIHEWLEIWVQEVAGFIRASEGLSARREAHTNEILDGRWKAQFESLRQTDPLGVYTTGWESAHPEPLLLDIASQQPVRAIDPATEHPWALCTNDALLEGAALPPYRSTLHRYLYVPKAGEGTTFVPVTPNAPRSPHTQDIEVILPPGRDLVPLNREGGHILVRRYCPIKWETVINRLGGIEWSGINHGKTRLKIGTVPAESVDAIQGSGWLFVGANGKAGRFCEAFHLKIKLLLEMLTGVRSFVERTQRPLLNLSPDSFDIDARYTGCGLPALWTLAVRLVDGGNAISLKVPSGETKYYLPAEPRMNTYRPQVVGRIPAGEGTFQIQRFLPSTAGLTMIEGQFFTSENVSTIAPNDMICLGIWLRGGRVDIFARLEAQPGNKFGELAFRTVGQRFAPDIVDALKEAEGVGLPHVPFEIIPLLSTPCDLYSLGVLATRMFLVDPIFKAGGTTLNVAKGEVSAFARFLEREPDPAIPTTNANDLARSNDELALLKRRKRIEAAFNREKRFIESLGPQRLVDESLTPEAAFGMLPAELWWDLLAIIIRMSPENGADAYCPHYGAARPGGLHRVFDGPIADLESLLIRSRSLLFIDWNTNREIQMVIEKARRPFG